MTLYWQCIMGPKVEFCKMRILPWRDVGNFTLHITQDGSRPQRCSMYTQVFFFFSLIKLILKDKREKQQHYQEFQGRNLKAKIIYFHDRMKHEECFQGPVRCCDYLCWDLFQNSILHFNIFNMTEFRANICSRPDIDSFFCDWMSPKSTRLHLLITHWQRLYFPKYFQDNPGKSNLYPQIFFNIYFHLHEVHYIHARICPKFSILCFQAYWQYCICNIYKEIDQAFQFLQPQTTAFYTFEDSLVSLTVVFKFFISICAMFTMR